MRKVRLQNVKSYVDQEITFNDGVNFISGINGAGKSTLIEAVGYALFDYNPGTISEFLRYGTKSGTITIEFCALDEREYRVIRKLGTSSLWAVFDLETESELDLHGSRDVKAWLKEALGIGHDMDLEQLFRDVIGVPQGTFVAPFLETPSLRKKKFDSVLKVEQYRNAFQNTRTAVKILEDSMREKEMALAVLANEVKDYDSVKEQIHLLTNKVKELDQQQKNLENLIKEKNKVVNDMENLKNDIEKARAELQTIGGILEGLKGRKQDLQNNLNQAETAAKLISKALKGYTAYLDLDEKLKVLEIKRREKESLEKQLNKVREDAASLNATIEGREKEIASREQEISNEKQELSSLLGEAERQVNRNKSEHNKLLEKQELIDFWRRDEEALSRVALEIQQLYREMHNKTELEQGSLAPEELELQARLKDLPNIERKAALLETKEAELTNTREKWAKMKERIQSIENDSQQAADGLCPFLKSPCQNVGGDLKGYFAERKAEVLKELNGLTELGTKLAAEVKEATKAKEALISLQTDNRRLEQIKMQRAALNKEIATLMEKAEALKVHQYIEKLANSVMAPLKTIETSQGGHLTRDRRAWEELANYLEKVLEESVTQRGATEKTHASQVALSAAALAKAVAEHDNILKGLKGLEAKTQHVEKEKITLIAQKKQQVDLYSLTEELNSQLSSYSKVENNTEKAKKEQAQYRPDYEIYMQNKSEAAKKDALETEVKKVMADIGEKETKAGELDSRISEMQSRFDTDLYEKEKLQLDQNKQSFSTQAQVLQERRLDLEEFKVKEKVLAKKLGEIKTLEQEMGEETKTRKLLDVIRGILNNAGAPIARVYLENLSREANEIYRQICPENAVLEWKPDYDITMTDNFQGRERVRTFKQFSGGEQMTAALAVRLALLKQQSMVRVGFFDEPTANLDTDRRMNLAETIPRVTGEFDQLFIISHDDTFDSMTDNVIQLRKDTETGSGIE